MTLLDVVVSLLVVWVICTGVGIIALSVAAGVRFIIDRVM